jgi:PhnB protein
MQANAYLNFDGRCEAAFKFYESCFGGKIVSMATFESAGVADQLPSEWRGKIMHAHMVIGSQVLMGADAPPDRYHKPEGFSMSIHPEQPADAERVFNALADKGSVHMPLQQTPWAVRFGMVVDQFGIPWMINCAASAAAA